MSSFGGGTYYPNNSFYGFWDNDGNIYVTDMTGQKKIGVTYARYNQIEKALGEAVQKAEGYLKLLEEHNIIKKELTPDEKISALAAQVEQLTNVVTALVATKQDATVIDVAPVPMQSEKEGKTNAEFVATGRSSQGFVAS